MVTRMVVMGVCWSVLLSLPLCAGGRTLRGSAVTGLDYEMVTGFAGEQRGSVWLYRGVRAGFRLTPERRVWYCALYRGQRKCRFAAGGLKLQMGNGLLLGSGGRFFCYSWRRRPPRSLVRIAPSLSFWNRQWGAALSVNLSRFSTQVAVFEQPDAAAAGASPRSALAALSARASHTLLGAALVVPLDRSGGDGAPKWERPVLCHLFSALEYGDMSVSGEWDSVGGERYGLLQFALLKPWFAGLKLFRAPDTGDIGLWEEIRRNRHDHFSGMAVRIEGSPLPARPFLDILSSVRSQDTRRVRFRRFGMGVLLKPRRGTNWRVETHIEEQRENHYPTSFWPVPPSAGRLRTLSFRSTLRLTDRWLQQRIRTTCSFERFSWRARDASVSIDLRATYEPVAVAVALHSYLLQSGGPVMIFRPGVASFEQWRLVYGRGCDLCIRARLTLRRGVVVTAYAGKPWQKDLRVYAAIRCKF